MDGVVYESEGVREGCGTACTTHRTPFVSSRLVVQYMYLAVARDAVRGFVQGQRHVETGGSVQEVRAQEAPVLVHGGEGYEGREVVEEAGVALQPLEDCVEK
jgi:hypothetical protein